MRDRFRIAKYIVIFAVGGAIYVWGGWKWVGWTLLVALIFAIAMHFFFRWKTNGWEDSWGPYKSLFKKG